MEQGIHQNGNQQSDHLYQCDNGHLIEHVCMNPKCKYEEFICNDTDCQESYKKHLRCQFFILRQYLKSNKQQDLSEYSNQITEYYNIIQRQIDSIKTQVTQTITTKLSKQKKIKKLKHFARNKESSEREGLNLYKEMKNNDAVLDQELKNQYKHDHVDFALNIVTEIQNFKNVLISKGLIEPKQNGSIQMQFSQQSFKENNKLESKIANDSQIY